jgi:tRNA(Ile)-lysidine synthase
MRIAASDDAASGAAASRAAASQTRHRSLSGCARRGYDARVKPRPIDPFVVRFRERWDEALQAAPPAADRRVLAAVSGGCDSVVLAWLLREVVGARGGSVTLAHVHHGLRTEAGDDEAFVHRLANEWQVPFIGARVDVRAAARAQGQSIEQAARTLRHTALEQLAIETRCRLIVLAHHMDDQAETLLLRLLRGTGPRGLGGMEPAVELPRRAGSHTRARLLIRPLLAFRRDELRAFARRNDLAWIEDLSNLDRRHLRNRIRLELIPSLRAEYNPRLVESLAALAEAQQRENELVARATRRADRRLVQRTPPAGAGGPAQPAREVRIDARGLAREPAAVATRLLWLAYQTLAGPAGVLETAQLRDLLRLLHPTPGAAHAEVHLSGRIRARRSRGLLRLEFHDPRPGNHKGVRKV